jgi:hypothetical protein
MDFFISVFFVVCGKFAEAEGGSGFHGPAQPLAPLKRGHGMAEKREGLAPCGEGFSRREEMLASGVATDCEKGTSERIRAASAND